MSTVTISHVARHAGVSEKTVSRVLNGEPHVRPALKCRVLAAVSTLGYSPNISARSLAGARSYLIALLFANRSPGYIAELQLGAGRQCQAHGYHLLAEPLDETCSDVEQNVMAVLAGVRVDGVILSSPACDNPGVLDGLERAGIPYVRVSPEPGGVYIDERRAACEITSLLLDSGHRQIGFIAGDPRHAGSELRRQGFVSALEERGLTPRANWFLQGDFSFASGARCAAEILSHEDLPTAIFASNDDMAVGVVSTAARLGMQVPRDLSVVGFDDTPSAVMCSPQLTTVRQPISQMGAQAADMLIRRADLDGAARRGEGVLMDFKIVVRESTGSVSSRA